MVPATESPLASESTSSLTLIVADNDRVNDRRRDTSRINVNSGPTLFSHEEARRNLDICLDANGSCQMFHPRNIAAYCYVGFTVRSMNAIGDDKSKT